MKKILFAFAALATIFAGCTKDIDERLTSLERRVDALEEYVTTLNSQVQGIQTIVANLEKKVYVTGVETLKNDSGAEIGYRLTFNQGNPIEIKHGNTGAQGLIGPNGQTPSIDMAEDGNWYWRYAGGDWLLDGDGNKIPVYKSLEFNIDEGHLYVSVDGSTPIDLGVVKGADGDKGDKGETGPQGDSWFDDVTVDEEAGTVTISIAGSEHDLVLPFNAAAADEFALNLQLPESTDVLLGGTINIGYTLAGCDAKDAGVFVQAPEDWKVAVDEAAQKIALTVGEKAGRVVVYAINNVTGEVRAKFVAYDPEAMLIVGVEKSAFYLLPDGSGSIEIPVSTGLNYRVEKNDWLTVTEAPATRAMTHKVYTITAGENTTGNTREGEVNFWTSDGSDLLYTVTVSQKGYNPALLVDGEGNPIKWQETFGLKIGSTTTNFKNDVTIELSDDFTKGTYKVKNMFKADLFFGATGMVMNAGADYYADLEDDILTIYKAEHSSYHFGGNVTLKVDLSEMTITSSANINCTTAGAQQKAAEIVDYKLEIPAPSQGGGSVNPLAELAIGEYAESGFSGNPAPGTLVIELSDDASKGDLLVKFGFETTKFYATVSGDASTMTITVPETSTTNWGPISASLTLYPSGHYIMGQVQYGWGTIYSYSAM